MTREQYDEFSLPLVRTMNDMEDEILRIVAAQLAKDGDFSDTSKWRIRQLARSGELGKETAELIASYSGVEMGQAMEAIEAAALTEIGYVDGAITDLARRGLFDSSVEIPAESSAMNAARAFKRQAKSDLNLVNTVMAYKAKSSFVNAVNSIYFESEKNRQRALNTMGKYSASNVMGHMSLQESTRRCIRELAEKGIPAFVDKRGHEWSPESYVIMDMRSTLGNTARAAQNMRCDEYGINLVEISSHLGARPLCAPYQGRIFSRDGSKGVTTDGNGNKIPYSPLSETSYGEAGGLFGVNCGHVQYPFFPGCSFQSYFPYPEEENAERYKQFQKQRYMERKIRATKRECMMFNETGDKEAFKEASVRLKQQRKAYKDYSQSAGLKVHNDRIQVYGFDRSVSSKAAWAERKSSGKALTEAANGGIIKSRSDTVALEYQRYGRNKDTLVNKTYIDSGEYRRKFDNLTDNPEVNKSLYDCAKKALKHRSGTEFEDMYWIDGDTGEIIKAALNEQTPMGVAYSDSIKKAISGKNNLITLHTHPHSMPPSADDFNSNYSHKYVTGVVACHNGKVFVYSSDQIVEPKLCDLYIAQFISEGHTEYEAQIMALEKMKQSHNIDFWEVK